MNHSVAERLGVESGDVVGITGRRRTVAKAMPGLPDDPDELIRIDGST